MEIKCKLIAIMAFGVILASASATTFDASELDDETKGDNWLAYGRTHSEQRYSPLNEINTETVSNLGLSWSVELPDARQIVSTTLAVDGILYITSSWSVVTAIDARTQKVLWKYDPDVVNKAGNTLRVLWGTSRGAAYWDGKLFVATGDGRLAQLQMMRSFTKKLNHSFFTSSIKCQEQMIH